MRRSAMVSLDYSESEGRVIVTGRGAQMAVHHVGYDPSGDGQC
jgi:hypothetical protein